jgi:hypothetical protein
LSRIKRGPFPGGRRPWGESRVWIKPDRVLLQDPSGIGFISRGGFSIHGGFEPGSSGCIDLHKNAPAFFKAISNAKANQITLYVCYK